MAKDIFIKVRRCTRPSTVHRRDTWGSPNGEKHAGSIARNQDRATEAADPEETLQRPGKPVIEARLPSDPNRWRLVRDRSRRQRRKLDEEICPGRRLRGLRRPARPRLLASAKASARTRPGGTGWRERLQQTRHGGGSAPRL